MEVRGEILILILLCMAATIVPRVLPFLAASKLRLSPRFVAWLRFLPSAILSAFLAPLLFPLNGEPPEETAAKLAAAAIAAAVSLKTGNIILTLVCGMLSFALFSALLARA
ncbi:MAG: AzlD domain-containing protein [Gammaproteobacteria bacterium]